MLVERGKEEQGENERLTRKKLAWSRKNCDQIFKSALKPGDEGREPNKTIATMKQSPLRQKCRNSEKRWSPAKQETQVQSLGWGDTLEKEMATRFSILM